jgi:hypothetical protein
MNMNIKEKKVEVELSEGGKINILVRKPTAKDLNMAQKIGAKVWTDSVKDGLFTKQSLAKFMEDNNIWNQQKQKERDTITQSIDNLEKELALGRSSGGKLKVSEGKAKAIELRRLRNNLRNLIAERISLESNTAEGLAENAKFNYLVSSCTFYEDGRKVYSNVEEYNNKAEDEIAFQAAATLGEMMFQLDKNYEENLPENQFLKRFHLVDNELSLIDKEGNKVDVDGTRVNEDGWLINEKGERIDREGNLLSEAGYLILQADYEDDVNLVDSEPKTKKKKANKETEE